MVTQNQIAEFLAQSPIAAAGVSRNPKKFGHTVFKELRKKGLQIIPINPKADEIDGIPTCKSVADLPEKVTALYIVTNKKETQQICAEAKKKGITHIWIQQTSETKEALAELEGSGINLISHQCILMHHEPNGIHKFHRGILKFFRKLPA